MIDKKIMYLLHKCIHIYDTKNDHDYLLAFTIGKNNPIQHCQITFNPCNFWHLLGCKIDNKKYPEAYAQCKNGKDISEIVSLVHNCSEVFIKSNIFRQIFDFTANARHIKIGYVAQCPEEFYLTMALGNEIGIIGYDYPKGNRQFLIPKSVQNKKISMVSGNLSKILFILSKNQSQQSYVNIEYEIKKGITTEYLPRLLPSLSNIQI